MKSNPITTRTARLPLVMSLPAARCLLAVLCALLAACASPQIPTRAFTKSDPGAAALVAAS